MPTGMDIGSKLSIEQVDLKGKRVIMRVDFNVPLDSNGNITNNQRIAASLPTIQYALDKGCKSIVLMSHLGRPDGKPNPSLSLKPVSQELERLISRPVIFLNDCVGADIEAACSNPADGSIILLENLRFHIEEEGSVKLPDGTKSKASPEDVHAFRDSLSKLGEIYVNDAFGTMHRAHSSIVGLSNLEHRVAGLLVKKELAAFAKVLEGDEKIDIAILGGAKVSDKIQLILHLLSRVNTLIIGGGMAFTLLKAIYNVPIGNSLYDQKGAEIAHQIMQEASQKNVRIMLPKDFVIGDKFTADAEHRIVDLEAGIPDGWMGLDIGPATAEEYAQVISRGKSVIWNGPMGVFEWEAFASGTKAVLDAMLEATKNGATTIVGGGDSATAVVKWDAEDGLTHVSTGGGASIELLEGKELPGISALSSSRSY